MWPNGVVFSKNGHLFSAHLPASAAAAKSLQSCLTLCDPTDASPPGSPVPGILQARTLEWVAISFCNAWKWKVKVKLLSRVRLFTAPWTAGYQAPPSMGSSRQEYWSGLPLPPPAHLPSPLKIRAWDKDLPAGSLLENVAAGGGSERKDAEKEGKPRKGSMAKVTTAWTIGLDPVEFSEDPYEECSRMSTGDERRKYVLISSHLPLITSGPGMSILLHFELST